MFLESLRFGKPKYNLRIRLKQKSHEIRAVSDTDNSLNWDEGIHQARILGRACDFASKRLSGNHYVTEKGYLLPELANTTKYPFLDIQKATLDISQNLSALDLLEKTLQGEEDHTHSEMVKLEYENGRIEFIKPEGKHLYLPLEREDLSDHVANLVKFQKTD